jgi:hypothetical protein
MLKERHGVSSEESLDSLLAITEYTARLPDFHRLNLRSLPVAHARNAACQAFWETKEINGKPFETSANDTLVMLDDDHVMQKDIIEKLAAHPEGVVGALATSRGEIPFLCAFGRGADGQIYNLTGWEEGELAECVVVGSGAIAIKRWVLWALQDRGPSWFRYEYGGYRFEPTDEMSFGYACAARGIHHYVDTKLWIPHITTAYTTPLEWKAWLADHPDVRQRVEVPDAYKDIVKAIPTVTAKSNGHVNPGRDDTWKEERKTPNIAEVITRRI